MRITKGIAALAVGAVLVACSAEAPTEPNMSIYEPGLATFAKGGNGNGASGAIPSDEVTLEDYDANDNALVCVKTVPEGNGQAPERTIVKDDKDGECPGGFEATELEAPELPLCTDLPEFPVFPSTDVCRCGIEAGGEFIPAPWIELVPGGPYLCEVAG